MKVLLDSRNSIDVDTTINLLEEIRVTMYLHPIIYSDSVIFSSVAYNKSEHRYHTDVNPDRIINGPLSSYGEDLVSPIKEEWESFIGDCKWLVEEYGFTIISTNWSVDSKKSEYIILFGIEGRPCGTLVYDLRLSDHPFDAVFPDEYKSDALDYLKMNKIIDGSATEAGIEFQIEQILVGHHKDDTWDKAFTRLGILLRRMKAKVIQKWKATMKNQ